MNQFKIFLASFLMIFTTAIGFSVRNSILKDWGSQFGFTQYELGLITGGGLVGFGIIIIIGSFFLDTVGYKKILMLAFLAHILSAVVTLSASVVFKSAGKDAAYNCLYWGSFLFAIGNGLCEAAVNPLVAALYPNRKTHYLNILHAGWPGGLVVGGLLAYCFAGDAAIITKLSWELLMGLFLIPVVIYGVLIFPEKLPEPETKKSGVSIGEMLMQFASPILILLLLLQAMVGYVELGTDSWITNIMENVISSKAFLLFIYTSTLMFVLRFFAGPIVERTNPLGLLMISGVLGFIGLTLLSKADSTGYAFLAATVYALGKTFLWPTMLGVAGERFPRGGALVMGTMGGIGMLSAGLLGTPGIGYKQDYNATAKLKELSPTSYDRYSAKDKNAFLFFEPFTGLSGDKVNTLLEPKPGESLEADYKKVVDAKQEVPAKLAEIHAWWLEAKPHVEEDKAPVEKSRLFGGREALRLTAYVPLAMAALYLLLVIYFKATGGYKQLHVHGQGEAAPTEF